MLELFSRAFFLDFQMKRILMLEMFSRAFFLDFQMKRIFNA